MVESSEFRRILGLYPTGVCAITALENGGPIGMIVGSFTSASLDPPLVAFFPGRKSTTWPRIAAAGNFCVNVLSSQQQAVCQGISRQSDDKFSSISHDFSPRGSPILEGATAWIDCSLQAVHDAGDHFIAVGLVHALGEGSAKSPMLFYRGQYGAVAQMGAVSLTCE